VTFDSVAGSLTGTAPYTAAGDYPLRVTTANGTDPAAGQDFVLTVPSTDGIGVYRGDGTWTLDSNRNNRFDPGTDAVFVFGLLGDTPVVGDWDGDGRSEIGVVRPDGNGALVFSLDANRNFRFDENDFVFTFGRPGDQIVVGDWDGDGRDELGVARPDGRGGLVLSLDANGNGVFEAALDRVFTYGRSGDRVLVGDWDGNGRDDLGVTRFSAEFGGPPAVVFALDSDGSGHFDATDAAFVLAPGHSLAVAGDWDGDGRDQVGLFYEGWWNRDENGNQLLDALDPGFRFGAAFDQPVLGRW
jgi:alpha-amylase